MKRNAIVQSIAALAVALTACGDPAPEPTADKAAAASGAKPGASATAKVVKGPFPQSTNPAM